MIWHDAYNGCRIDIRPILEAFAGMIHDEGWPDESLIAAGLRRTGYLWHTSGGDDSGCQSPASSTVSPVHVCYIFYQVPTLQEGILEVSVNLFVSK